jgi:cyclopropane fatty-acyl-phospholipid synthase-like methyltransferase
MLVVSSTFFNMSDKESYYARFTDERKAYQKAYYEKNKEALKRKKELDATLKPEKVRKMQDYQHNYYLTNRQKLLERKRLRYLESKNG